MKTFFFWIIAAMVSVFGAEIVAGSFLFPFTSTWGWVVLMPLYGLHLVVLAWLVYHWGRPHFRTLYLAGMLFGLYEAYISKVLWFSGWGALPHVAGIGIFEFVLLVCWWHPFMAFMVPLMVSERLMTTSRTVHVPRRWIGLTILGVVVVMLWVSPIEPLFLHLAAIGVGAGIIAVPVLLWRYANRSRMPQITDLMPSNGVFAFLGVALLVLYGVLGAFLSPQYLPQLADQIGVWVLYLVIVTLFVRALRHSRS